MSSVRTVSTASFEAYLAPRVYIPPSNDTGVEEQGGPDGPDEPDELNNRQTGHSGWSVWFGTDNSQDESPDPRHSAAVSVASSGVFSPSLLLWPVPATPPAGSVRQASEDGRDSRVSWVEFAGHISSSSGV
jgi:hypothetical protein